MHIQTVLHFDKEGREAEVIVSDGECELLCHAFPIAAVEIGMPVSGLSGFSCGNVVRAENPHCGVTKLPPYFAYHMTGILFSEYCFPNKRESSASAVWKSVWTRIYRTICRMANTFPSTFSALIWIIDLVNRGANKKSERALI